MFGKLTPEQAQKAHEEKLEVFQDIIKRRKKPSRMPTISNDGLWRFIDQGLKLTEVLYNYEMIQEAVRRNQEEFGYDCQVEIGMLNRVKNQEAFGKSRFVVQDDPPSVQITDDFPMTAEDYPLLIEKGITKFIFEDLLCRHFGYKDKEDVIAHLKEATEAMMEYQAAYDREYSPRRPLPGRRAAPMWRFYHGPQIWTNPFLRMRRSPAPEREPRRSWPPAC